MGDVIGLEALADLFGRKAALMGGGDGGSLGSIASSNDTVVHSESEERSKVVTAFAAEFYGYYTSFVYLTPIAGGLLADQFFGQHAMIIAGAVIMAVGHGLLSSNSTFLFGLLFIIIGNGCFKPNISARIGKIYDRGERRRGGGGHSAAGDDKDHHQQQQSHNLRDEAFSIFYCAINLGAFLAPLVVGTVRSSLGYGWAFSAAGFGMVLGLVIYVIGTYMLGEGGGGLSSRQKNASKYDILLPVSTADATDKMMEESDWDRVPLSPNGERLRSEIRSRSSTSGTASDELQEIDLRDKADGHHNGIDVDSKTDLPEKAEDSNQASPRGLEGEGSEGHHGSGEGATFSRSDLPRILALICVCLLSVCFWAVFEQQGSTIALFSESDVNRNVTIGGRLLFVIPTEYVQSINPIFILILTPFVNTLWRKQSKKGQEPKPLTKMSIGCFLLGLGYGFLVFGELLLPSSKTDQHSKISIFWLVCCLGLGTLGELYLSPVGLSFVSAVAPSYMTSLSVGFWMLSSFGGNMLAGHIGALYPYTGHTKFFMICSAIALANSLVFGLMSRPLGRMLVVK